MEKYKQTIPLGVAFRVGSKSAVRILEDDLTIEVPKDSGVLCFDINGFPAKVIIPPEVLFSMVTGEANIKINTVLEEKILERINNRKKVRNE